MATFSLLTDSFNPLVQTLALVQYFLLSWAPIMTGFLMADWSCAWCECSISAPAVLTPKQPEQVKPGGSCDPLLTSAVGSTQATKCRYGWNRGSWRLKRHFQTMMVIRQKLYMSSRCCCWFAKTEFSNPWWWRVIGLHMFRLLPCMSKLNSCHLCVLKVCVFEQKAVMSVVLTGNRCEFPCW